MSHFIKCLMLAGWIAGGGVSAVTPTATIGVTPTEVSVTMMTNERTMSAVAEMTETVTEDVGCLCWDSDAVVSLTAVSRTATATTKPTATSSSTSTVTMTTSPSGTISSSHSLSKVIVNTATVTPSATSSLSLRTSTASETITTPTAAITPTATSTRTLPSPSASLSLTATSSPTPTETVSLSISPTATSSVTTTPTMTTSNSLSPTPSLVIVSSTLRGTASPLFQQTLTETATIPRYSFACCPWYTPPPVFPPFYPSDDDGFHWGGVPGWGWLLIGIVCGACLLFLILFFLMKKTNASGYTLGKQPEGDDSLQEMSTGAGAHKGSVVEVVNDDKEPVLGVVVDTNDTGVWVTSESFAAAKFFTEYRIVNDGQSQFTSPALPNRELSTLSSVRHPGEPPVAGSDFPSASAPIVFIKHDGTMSINNLRQVQVQSPTSPGPLDGSAFPPSPTRSTSANMINSNFGNIQSSSAQAPFKSLPFEYPEPVRSPPTVGAAETSAPPLSPLV